ncbi:MAG: hypothetical protein JJU29_15010 [Verrucomicrobia bacterium]|nr:hypothetical protein [Verrucomicrobiota bacterium]MCH8513170.1 hypothetical protein [Kiritimatiellia bacterium]
MKNRIPFLLTLFLLTPGAWLHADSPVKTYNFPANAPRFMTTLVRIENAEKLRPIVIYGRGHEGAFKADPAHPADNEADFTLRANRYNESRVDTERMAAGAWVARADDRRPDILIRITRVEVQERENDHRYRVRFTGTLTADGHEVPIQSAGSIRFAAAGRVQGHRASDRVYLSTEFTIAGEDLGLEGDDAGEIKFRVQAIGYTRA